MSEKKKARVAGGMGWLGRSLVEYLAAQGD